MCQTCHHRQFQLLHITQIVKRRCNDSPTILGKKEHQGMVTARQLLQVFYLYMKLKPSEALEAFGSDKVHFRSPPPHHYGDFYDEMFGKLKGPLNILEIGVYFGQSLMAWRHAFPDAQITGIDIEGVGFEEKYRINFIKGDIKTIELTEKYDVIIDDSSHDLRESTYIVKNFCENLTAQGVMIIEDIQIPVLYENELLKVLPEGFLMESYDFRYATKGLKHDDYIIKIIRE